MRASILTLAVAGLAGCGPNNFVKEVPESVWGEWTTDSEEYAGRAFRLSARQLTIVINEHTQFVHDIDRIEVKERHGRPFMTLFYRNRDGIDDTFRIEYAEYPTTFIRLENLDRIRWHRSDESSVELTAGR